MNDKACAFGRLHPAVTFFFYLTACVLCASVDHPAYVAVALPGAVLLYLSSSGWERGKRLLLPSLVPVPVFAAVNPLLNTGGEQVLFSLFGRPYTAESMLWGAVNGASMSAVLLLCAAFSATVSGEDFTALFGNAMPALSLLLVMVFRLIPDARRKLRQVSVARDSIGLGTGSGASRRRQLEAAGVLLSCLTSWMLENSVITADSMRSRGYGCAVRTAFASTRFTGVDRCVGAALLLCAAGVFRALFGGWTATSFTPVLSVPPLAGGTRTGLLCFGIFFLLPVFINIREKFIWHNLRSAA